MPLLFVSHKTDAIFNTSLSPVGHSSVVRTGRSPGSRIYALSAAFPTLRSVAKRCGSSVTVAGPRRICTGLPF